MQRNIEVQNENRALKEEMDEMERELVNAKMSHAQVSSCPSSRSLSVRC
jgi:cell division septum initiation protein DivIVA